MERHLQPRPERAGLRRRLANPDASNGGVSVIFARPWYQNGVARVVGNARGVPDITMSAACNGAIENYQSSWQPRWYLSCGTSEATPLFAGIVALADQVAGHSLGHQPRPVRHEGPQRTRLVPVTSGNNTPLSSPKAVIPAHGCRSPGQAGIQPGVGTRHSERGWLCRPRRCTRVRPARSKPGTTGQATRRAWLTRPALGSQP